MNTHTATGLQDVDLAAIHDNDNNNVFVNDITLDSILLRANSTSFIRNKFLIRQYSGDQFM